MKKLITLALASSLFLPSCMTTYDRHGRPVQSVDPGLAAVGIIGAGLVGAAIASSNNDDDYHHHRPHHRPHKPHRPHRPVHHEPVHCHY